MENSDPIESQNQCTNMIDISWWDTQEKVSQITKTGNERKDIIFFKKGYYYGWKVAEEYED